jgi:hypothetical protein
MKHTMKKFSRGGAQGMYDRRMADIEKDFKKNSAGKSGKALEVLEAKRMQRTADAEDDRAKRTGADRTATRAAERAAESNLTKTRKYGAPQSVTKDPGPVAKVTESLSIPKMDSSIGKKPAAAKPVQKSVQKPAATTPKRMGDQGFAYKKKDMPSTGKGVSTHYRYVRGGSNSGAAADGTAAQRLANKGLETGRSGTGTSTTSTTSTNKGGVNSGRSPGILSGMSFGELGGYRGRGNITVQPREARQTSSSNNAATDAARAAKLATLKKAAEAPGATQFAKDRYKSAVSSGMYAKGGKMKKYAKGGVTKEMPSSNQMGSMGMAKGGKAKAKPAAKGKAKGNPFAATKFGAAMMKKSADTEGRGMKKFAKGGSIDGCAQRGKTKLKRVTMKKGGKTC